ncbi:MULTISPECIES: YafY family protein [unclassified Paludibacterium]|uniref:helix-turn-helix transcriptional regulator n=1 Tax=unclassified Paludibacterium TaxID=2618429 RepID=UPI001C0440D4|nr:YafY family protein [Paludibacterium sp. B53371]BEV71420.1 YafY family protein [Paludibacterium sp. THUN1379]
MSRAARLLDLLQQLRQYRYPVSGATLAQQLGISLRTLYRDIATLQAQGAHIEGEAGLGYVLRPGFMLPPLMLDEEELEALMLGSQWVAQRGDERLSQAARGALAKIAAVLPADLRRDLDGHGLLVPATDRLPVQPVDLALVRQAIRRGQVLAIHYRDLNGQTSQRRIWPFALGYFEHVRMLAAWCETRQDFRHFRTDRILSLSQTGERYPRPRQALLKAWKQREGLRQQP